ncbi:MAG: hypothetical protein K2I06_02880 [Ruminococcus sp.]|nr:hypothetical protein [Ruminococcus sp.]
MDILNELIDRFMTELDNELCDFSEKELPPEKASELHEIVGKLTSAVFQSACKAGIKLRARIEAGLIKEK